jgi:hypothetical protein
MADSSNERGRILSFKTSDNSHKIEKHVEKWRLNKLKEFTDNLSLLVTY